MEKIKLSCKRCLHKWKPRKKVEDIIICPKCGSPYWNKPKRGVS